MNIEVDLAAGFGFAAVIERRDRLIGSRFQRLTENLDQTLTTALNQKVLRQGNLVDDGSVFLYGQLATTIDVSVARILEDDADTIGRPWPLRLSSL